MPPRREFTVAGVDGCPYGWCVARLTYSGERLVEGSFTRVRQFRQLLERIETLECVAVDIPIGLPEPKDYPRACDTEAKRLLGPERSASVFPVPPRELVRRSAGKTYNQAKKLSQEIHGRMLSVQTFNILEKVREVDRAMSADLQRCIVEVHPEVAFVGLNSGKPIGGSKKTPAGFRARYDLLGRYLPTELIDESLGKYRREEVGRDDALDALVSALAAVRIVRKRFRRLPAKPPRDSTGLRMEILCPRK